MLKEIEPEADNSETKDLPNSGAELVRWVQVLLKTSGDDSIEDMKGLVHQATVRADVVVELIQELQYWDATQATLLTWKKKTTQWDAPSQREKYSFELVRNSVEARPQTTGR